MNYFTVILALCLVLLGSCSNQNVIEINLKGEESISVDESTSHNDKNTTTETIKKKDNPNKQSTITVYTDKCPKYNLPDFIVTPDIPKEVLTSDNKLTQI